jgi:cytochrome c biogenesis protein CcdA
MTATFAPVRAEFGNECVLAGVTKNNFVGVAMIAATSLVSVMLGASIAYAAEQFPDHVEALETGAGILLIGGFALVGVLLPFRPI